MNKEAKEIISFFGIWITSFLITGTMFFILVIPLINKF